MYGGLQRRYWLALLITLSCAALGQAEESNTGPWDVPALHAATPKVWWLDAEGTARGLFYEGEPYRGKPTRVFAYYARPAEVKGKLPTMVLVHGGGGRAFKEWAELWAARGYAALAMAR